VESCGSLSFEMPFPMPEAFSIVFGAGSLLVSCVADPIPMFPPLVIPELATTYLNVFDN
jgi:hypothetical protein